MEAIGQLRSGPQPVGMPSEGALIPRKGAPKAQCIHRLQCPLKTKVPETLKQHMDLVDKPPQLALLARAVPGGEQEEDRKESQWEEDWTYLDPGLLSYINKLCSQEDFVIKVEEVIHPQFLAQLLSPEVQLDFLALTEDLLEQEKRLTPVQVEKRLLASEKEEGVPSPLSHKAPELDLSPSESVAGQYAQGCDLGPQLGVSDKASPTEIDFEDCQRPGQADAHLSQPKAFAVSSGHQEFPSLWVGCLHFAPQDHRSTYPGLGPRETSIFRGMSSVRETSGPVGRSGEKGEGLPILWASAGSPPPSTLSLSPFSASALAYPGGQGSRGAAQCQPQKRKCDDFVTGRWRKRHCSQ